MTSATDRFKMLLANALERVCVLEAELEQARKRIVEPEHTPASATGQLVNEAKKSPKRTPTTGRRDA